MNYFAAVFVDGKWVHGQPERPSLEAADDNCARRRFRRHRFKTLDGWLGEFVKADLQQQRSLLRLEDDPSEDLRDRIESAVEPGGRLERENRIQGICLPQSDGGLRT